LVCAQPQINGSLWLLFCEFREKAILPQEFLIRREARFSQKTNFFATSPGQQRLLDPLGQIP
jgi:hypothetical protein